MMSRGCPRLTATLSRSINQSSVTSHNSFHRTFAKAAVSTKTKQSVTSSINQPGLITDLSLADFEEDNLPYDKNDPIFKQIDHNNMHTPARLNSMAEKYKWINWTRFGDHLHRSDVHFFDEEVKIVDENLDVEADKSALEEQAKAEEHDILVQAHAKKLRALLPFQAYIDSGSTTRVTKFGKMRSTWVFSLAGDKCGTATYGFGKGPDMITAIERCEKDMIHNLTFLPLVESRTILYETVGKFGVCKVSMRPLPRGTGMVAGIIPRLVFEAFGIEDINAKVLGRALPKHQVLACWQALTQQRGLRELSIARGSRAHKMFERGTQRPRTPPRAVMAERALEISRKLKEANELMVRMPPETIIEDMEKEKALEDRIMSQMDKDPPAIDISDPNNPYDTDDVEDGNEIMDMAADSQHWGPQFALPPNYVPVLPPKMPRIPRPVASGSRQPSNK